MKKAWIGIDPGQQGAIGIIFDDQEARTIDMPLIGGKEVDAYFMHQMLVEIHDEGYVINVGLEKAQPMPKQGVTGVFTYGDGYGALKAVLRINQIPFVKVRPNKWKKHFSLGKSKKAAFLTAQDLFPDVDYYGPRGGLKDGRAEALLIAQYIKDGGK